MSGFDDYVGRITGGLNLSPAGKEQIRQEALSHLEDEAARLVKAGKDRDEAEALSIEAFGKDDTIAALVDRALAKRQRRYKRFRRVLTVTGAVLLVVFIIGFGAWFSVFDDTISGVTFVGQLPGHVFPILYVGAWAWGLAMLAAVAYRLSGIRKRPFIVAVALVLVAFVAAVIAFGLSPLGDTFGYTSGEETPVELATKSFVMYAWLTVIPTCLTAAVGLVLGRSRTKSTWLLALTFPTCLLSAALKAASRMDYAWLMPYKWPKLASVGLVALVFVMLVVFLARSIGAPRDRKADESFTRPAAETAAL